MRSFYSLVALASMAMMAQAAQVTDVISSTTLEIPEAYAEQEAKLNSDAVYLVTLKDEGSGPQFKAGSSGIATKVSGGTIARVEVAWGSKSNENIEIYGQHTPYAASNAVITGTLLGTIEFSAGATVSLDIDPGQWEYIGVTTTAIKGKAAQIGSISFTWDIPGDTPDEPCQGIIISEVCGNDATADGHEDWVELYNPTDKTLDLSGVEVVKIDEDGLSETLCVISDGTAVNPGKYYVAEKGTDFTAGISNNKPVTICLVSPLGVRLDMFDKSSEFTHNGSHPAGGSYSRHDNTGSWYVTDLASKGEANREHSEIVISMAKYRPLVAEELKDGIEVIIVNAANGYAMSYDWDTTKDGSVYQKATADIESLDCDLIMADVNAAKIAVITLQDGGDGTWALKFGETNNYLNDSKYMACTGFKNIDFKKKDDPAKGTRATITFNEGGDAEIAFGEAGVLKFNLKKDNTSRFLNYDPTDKPEDHLAVHIYTLDKGSSAISGIATDSDAAPVYYNMQGMRVANPSAGLYIKHTGDKAVKVLIR